MDLGSGTLSKDCRTVDENGTISKVDDANGPQENGECKCSLCIMTLASDAPAYLDMETFKAHFYQPGPAIPAPVVLPCRRCQVSKTNMDVDMADRMVLLSLDRAASGWLEESNDWAFWSSLSTGRPACYLSLTIDYWLSSWRADCVRRSSDAI